MTPCCNWLLTCSLLVVQGRSDKSREGWSCSSRSLLPRKANWGKEEMASPGERPCITSSRETESTQSFPYTWHLVARLKDRCYCDCEKVLKEGKELTNDHLSISIPKNTQIVPTQADSYWSDKHTHKYTQNIQIHMKHTGEQICSHPSSHHKVAFPHTE